MTVYTPHPPVFINGPASLLLTNATGFQASINAEMRGYTAREDNTSGELLGQGTKLLYAPTPKETTEKHQRPGGFSFIWDAQQNRGFVLSEALQGYAPISANWQATNVAVQIKGRTPEKVGGHETEQATAAVQETDGTNALFEVVRALDLKGFPLQIRSAENAAPLTFSVTKFRFVPLSPDVFTVPDGYTRYSSPEALSDELAIRQSNLRLRRRGTEGELMAPPPSSQTPGYYPRY